MAEPAGGGGGRGCPALPTFFQEGPRGGLIYAFISTILLLHECI